MIHTFNIDSFFMGLIKRLTVKSPYFDFLPLAFVIQ